MWKWYDSLNGEWIDGYEYTREEAIQELLSQHADSHVKHGDHFMAHATIEDGAIDIGDAMREGVVILTESGHETGMNFFDYIQKAKRYGENPYNRSANAQDFTFVSVGYAKSDSNWYIPEGWPEDLPLWKCRPQ